MNKRERDLIRMALLFTRRWLNGAGAGNKLHQVLDPILEEMEIDFADVTDAGDEMMELCIKVKEGGSLDFSALEAYADVAGLCELLAESSRIALVEMVKEARYTKAAAFDTQARVYAHVAKYATDKAKELGGGLALYIIVHTHAHGEDLIPVWSEDEPTQEQIDGAVYRPIDAQADLVNVEGPFPFQVIGEGS